MSTHDYQISSPIIYSSVPIEKGISTMTLITTKSPEVSEYAVNRISQKYDSYQGLIYRDRHRRRLSSTGDGSGDSSTTASGSSYGEREDGSEGRAESDDSVKDERMDHKPLDGHVTEAEKHQVETFFKGLKTQVSLVYIYIIFMLFLCSFFFISLHLLPLYVHVKLFFFHC